MQFVHTLCFMSIIFDLKGKVLVLGPLFYFLFHPFPWNALRSLPTKKFSPNRNESNLFNASTSTRLLKVLLQIEYALISLKQRVL